MSAPAPLLTEFVSQTPMRAGAVHWPDSDKVTVVVKVTLVIDARGAAEVVVPGSALSLDVCGDDGELTYPSDFAPFKPRCDCVIVGEALGHREGIATLSCGTLVKEGRERVRFGPRELFARAGDPTEASAVKAWSSGQIDFARFHCAPPDQRTDHCDLPLLVAYRRGDVDFVAEFRGPPPEAAIFDQSGWSAPLAIPLALDTVCIAPVEHQLTLLWRGVAGLKEQGADAPLLAVALGSLRSHPARTILGWERKRLVLPNLLRQGEPSGRSDDQGSNVTTEADAAPEFSDKTISMVKPPTATPLPFRSDESDPSSVRESRNDAADDNPFAGGTELVRAPLNSRALPFESQNAPDSGNWNRGTHLIAAHVVQPATPFERPSASGAVDHVPSARSSGSGVGASPRTEPMPGDASRRASSGVPFGAPSASLERTRAAVAMSPSQANHIGSEDTIARPGLVPAPVAAIAPLPAPVSPSPPGQLAPIAALPPAHLAPSGLGTLGMSARLDAVPTTRISSPSALDAGASPRPVAPPATSAPGPSPAAPVSTPDHHDDLYRTVQDAIWRGDKPLNAVLAEFKLSETEWRAMKRLALQRLGQ